jgi:hypothetical protein
MTRRVTRCSSSTARPPRSIGCRRRSWHRHPRRRHGRGRPQEGRRRGCDVFLALTEGDNRNVMAAQLAAEELGIDRVIAKINDPLRAKAYAELGIATLCRTGLMVDAVDHYLGFPRAGSPGCSPRPDTTGPTTRTRRDPPGTRPGPSAGSAQGQASRPDHPPATPSRTRDPHRPRRPRPCSYSSSAGGRSATTSPRNSSNRP